MCVTLLCFIDYISLILDFAYKFCHICTERPISRSGWRESLRFYGNLSLCERVSIRATASHNWRRTGELLD